jgi:hypothetical protein
MSLTLKAVVAVAIVAALGVLTARVIGGFDDDGATRTFHVGGADLTVTGAWQRLDAGKLAKGSERLLVTLTPADAPGPSPGATPASAAGAAASPVPRVPGTGAPQRVRLGGYDAWGYGDARVLPTTRGMLTVECGCGDAVRAVSVPGAAILAPAPDLALRLRAPAVLKQLDAIRAKERGGWTPASAARLAAAHRAALTQLAGLATPELARALKDAATAYDELARAPSASPSELTAADRALDAAVAQLALAGAPRVQRPAAAPDDGGFPVFAFMLIALAAALVAALTPAALRRLRSSRPGDTAPPASRPRASQPADAAPPRRAPSSRNLFGRGTPDEPAPLARRHAAPSVYRVAGGATPVEPKPAEASARTPERLFGRDLSEVVVTGPGEVEAEPGDESTREEPRTPIAAPPAYGRWDEPPRGSGAAPQDGARETTTASSSTA